MYELSSQSSDILYLFQRPPHPTQLDYEYSMNGQLKLAIREDYKDISYLKDEVAATAMGMFSSGWVWVAVTELRRIVVIPTFGPGTILVRGRQQRFDEALLAAPPQDPDYRPPQGDLPPPSRPKTAPKAASSPPAASSPVSGVSTSSPDLVRPSDSSQARYTSTYASANSHNNQKPTITHDQAKLDLQMYNERGRHQWHYIGDTFTPLFCVSVHEHMWMAGGYGVWGKEEYLKRFWKVLDWKKIGQTYSSLSRLRIYG